MTEPFPWTHPADPVPPAVARHPLLVGGSFPDLRAPALSTLSTGQTLT